MDSQRNALEISFKFQNKKHKIKITRPLEYSNLIESLKEQFDDFENFSILMCMNDSDFLVPLDTEQDFDNFLSKNKNLANFESNFELNLVQKERDISLETFHSQIDSPINDGIFIPESTSDFAIDKNKLFEKNETTSFFKSSNSPTQIENQSVFTSTYRYKDDYVASDLSNNDDFIINCIMGKIIGRGSFGTVNQCCDLNTGKIYAVKHVSFTTTPFNSNLKKAVDMLQSENDILKNLKHERIVKYYGSQVLSEGIYIFLEFMPGGTLRDKINKDGPIREKLVKMYTRQILEGLVYLHSNNLIHRDVKGSNILCDLNGDIKLTDFGATIEIKNILTKLTRNNNDGSSYKDLSRQYDSFIGTPHFMSPEVIKGEKYGRKVDIWSLGCTLVEMFTCKPPWHDLEQMQLVYQIFANKNPVFSLPSDVSEEAREFLNLTFCFEYEKRPTSSELLNHNFIKTE